MSVADGVDGRVDVAGDGEVARPAEMTLDRARENGKAHPRAAGRGFVAHRRSGRTRSSGHLSSDQATSSRCDGLRVTGTAPCRVYVLSGDAIRTVTSGEVMIESILAAWIKLK